MAVQPAIFVVDDDARTREFVRVLLEFAGLGNIRTYEESHRFLDEASLRDGDVVLLELRLPRFDGLAVQRELNRRGDRIAVIMMAANAEVPIVVKAMQAGATDFIEKPFSNEALVASVQRALAVAQRRDRGGKRSDDLLRRLDTLTGREREVSTGWCRAGQTKWWRSISRSANAPSKCTGRGSWPRCRSRISQPSFG